MPDTAGTTRGPSTWDWFSDLADYLLIAEAVLGVPGRNGIDWTPPSTEETVSTVEAVAADEISEREFASWLRSSRSKS
jgi:hypothetical protein